MLALAVARFFLLLFFQAFVLWWFQLVFWLVCASCTKLYALENTVDVLYALTTNGSTCMIGPQKTTYSSLIILYIICSYSKHSEQHKFLDSMSFLVLVLQEFATRNETHYFCHNSYGRTVIISIHQSAGIRVIYDCFNVI